MKNNLDFNSVQKLSRSPQALVIEWHSFFINGASTALEKSAASIGCLLVARLPSVNALEYIG